MIEERNVMEHDTLDRDIDAMDRTERAAAPSAGNDYRDTPRPAATPQQGAPAKTPQAKPAPPASQSRQSERAGDGSQDADGAQRRKMTRAEAGRKGGLRTKERHGQDYFGRIGRLGGKKGGEATKQRYGVEFYRNIGRKGGSR